MKRFFRNLNWKNILIISLALVLGVGAIAGVSSLVKNDKTTLSSLEFKRGALNDLGFYIESDQSIYTKDLIECQGLEIEPDFETMGTYQVYYYDSNKQFIGKTDKINSQTDGVYVNCNEFVIAKYCRIVITPEFKDEDGNVYTERTIKFYEVAGIAGEYKISVDKDQSLNVKKIFNANNNVFVGLGQGFTNDSGFVPSSDSGFYWFDTVNTAGKNFIVFKVATSSLNIVLSNTENTFNIPVVYHLDDSSGISGVDGNNRCFLIATCGDVSYVGCNIAEYDSVHGFVDEKSYSVLEIYLF